MLWALHPLGPWKVIDEVYPQDPRYFNAETDEYAVLDPDSRPGETVTYAVVSVDKAGGHSGMTNLTIHETQAPAAERLGKVYVMPNPLIVSSGLTGSDPRGDILDRIQFVGLTRRCTIRIYSYTGQLVRVIEHNQDAFGEPWYQLSTNNKIIASGVYFFVVEDHDTGDRASYSRNDLTRMNYVGNYIYPLAYSRQAQRAFLLEGLNTKIFLKDNVLRQGD